MKIKIIDDGKLLDQLHKCLATNFWYTIEK